MENVLTMIMMYLLASGLFVLPALGPSNNLTQQNMSAVDWWSQHLRQRLTSTFREEQAVTGVKSQFVTGTVLPKTDVGGGESTNRPRVKGKMTPTLRNMEADG